MNKKRNQGRGKGVKETSKGKVELTLFVTLTPDEMEVLETICQTRKKSMQAILEKEIKKFIYSYDPMSILP